MLLSAIIVNYNVKYYLYQCLRSLHKACRGMEWEVFVVDNKSSDGSVDYLRETFPAEEFPELHIVANDENLGFGKANNKAFAMASGKYVVFVNPDTFVGEETLAECVGFMSAHADAGCLGVKMLNANGSFAMESRRGVPTPWASLCKITRLNKLFPKNKLFGRYYMEHLPLDKAARIEIVSGAFMMVNREVAEKMGVFDDDYFMYCEDTDFSYRMLLAGYSNYYYPAAILHYKGESTKRYSYSFVNTFYKAILIFFRKHFNKHFLFLRAIMYVAIYVLGFLSFVRGQYRECVYNLKRLISPHKPFLLCLSGEDHRAMLDEMSHKFDFDYEMCVRKVENSAELAALVERHSPDYIMYDTTLYGYSEILSLAQALPAAQKRNIATLYPEKSMMLTPQYLFVL